jgi:hypothetical protein
VEDRFAVSGAKKRKMNTETYLDTARGFGIKLEIKEIAGPMMFSYNKQ